MKHVQAISQPRAAAIGPGYTFLQQLVLFLTKGKVLPFL
jgi:hypothetical protein